MGTCWSKDMVHAPHARQFDRLNPKGLESWKSWRETAQRVEPATTPSEFFHKLPDSLFKRVLELLPTTSLVQMRCVCKRWNAFILSSEINPRSFTPKTVLLNFSATELAAGVYCSRASHWELERKSLSFLLDWRVGDIGGAVRAPQFGHQWMRLVASGGGLLCFTSASYFWAFMLCNPLTKKWKRLQIPLASRLGGGNPTDARMPLPPWIVNPSSNKYQGRGWQAKLSEEVAVCIVPGSDNAERGSYKLVVAALYEGSMRTTLVYHSKTAVWKKIASLPVLPSKDSRFCSRAIACNGHMYCLTGEFQDRYAIFRRPTRLLKCDLQKESWSYVVLISELGFTNNLVEHWGRLLLLTNERKTSASWFTFRELRESGGDSGIIPTALIPKGVGEWLNDCQKQSNFHFSTRCLGMKNVLYISVKMDKNHKVLVYDGSNTTYRITDSPKQADYIYDTGWEVFSPALHVSV